MKYLGLIVFIVAIVPLVSRSERVERIEKIEKVDPKATKTTSETVTHRVTFDITIGGENVGQVELGLFWFKAPKTVKNFFTFATMGYRGAKYEGSIIHSVIKDSLIQGGDFQYGNGTGGFSIFGDQFADELPSHKHTSPGLLSMANRGPNTNGSQFIITTAVAPQLDGKNVVFGKVLRGMEVIRKIEATKTDGRNRPVKAVKIAKSTGEILEETKRIKVDF